MLRLILTLAVGFALLVGVGAWFDPEGAREAIRRDLSGLATQAADRAGDVVRDVVEQAVDKAKEAVPAAAVEEATPSAPPSRSAAGPRTEKKRPPVIAKTPAPAAAQPKPTPAAAQPKPAPLEVEEVAFVAPGEFVESPLEPPPAAEAADADWPPTRADEASPELAPAAAEVGERGVLIRRMLALYERMSERR